MDPLDFQPVDFTTDPNQHRFTSTFFNDATWPLQPLNNDSMAHHQQHHQDMSSPGASSTQAETVTAGPHLHTSLGIRTSMAATTSMAPLQTAGFALSHGLDPTVALLTGDNDMTFNLFQGQQAAAYEQDSASTMDPLSAFAGNFALPLHTSPIDGLVATTTQEQINNSLASSYMDTYAMDQMNMTNMAFQMSDFNNLLANNGFTSNAQTLPTHTNPFNVAPSNMATVASSNPNSSPSEGNWLDARSYSNRSDNSWINIDNQGRTSFDGYSDGSPGVVSPQHLHVRTDSSSSHDSEVPLSAHSVGSYEEIFPVSPEPDSNHHGLSFPQNGPHGLQMSQHDISDYQYHSPLRQSPMPPVVRPMMTSHVAQASSISSSSSSPISSGVESPKTKRRTSPVSPIGVTPKTIIKKTKGVKGADKPEKKVGKRRGPLRPEQRQQAHEIRKLRACLRCKFLKKVCDKGEPCGGCKPSHARLWQVPCTRIDIKDIAYFLKDWKADYERHVTLDVSITNIKGFSQHERLVHITHGYGFVLPIYAREVFVHNDDCFGVDWVESIHEKPRAFEVMTHRLSSGMEGIPAARLSEYIDIHLDRGFDRFVNEYFEGTPFLTEMLKSIHRYYLNTQLDVIRKGLKLVIAYALTLHITMLSGVADDESDIGRIDDPGSRYHGQVCAPVMINFQVKKAMADMWRELMKEILEELSALYSSVYTKDKLKNWPTIFILAILILAVWEMMQFDQHYRVPEETAVKKFCNEMESIPVGVIVGLFCAISTKLPGFLEWDTAKHAHVLNEHAAACNTMTEVRAHVEKHEQYLKTRAEAKFDREDFDSLSNKFLSKLVIRS